VAADTIRMIKGRTASINEDLMADPHQVNSIIATAILDGRKDHPDNRMNAEEAKQIAKCIIDAPAGAGLQIVPMSEK
jgi:hypothetical protein